jgi:cellulose synthase operon protein C
MPKKKKPLEGQSIEILAQKAADLLAKSHHKEAIDTYKQLLKKEQREEWKAALAKAYLLRAQTLANKGLYKEAAVLWENRANLCNDKKDFDQYLHWLIQGDRHVRAARLFVESAEQLPEELGRQLLAHFGAFIVAGNLEIIDAFPEDSPLVQHHRLVKAALEAYAQQDEQATEDALKQIPFRSPYRDIRTIIKALLMIESAPNAAYPLLEKVPLNSPYAPFAELIRLAVQEPEVQVSQLNQLGIHEQSFIAKLKGWDKKQLKVFSTLQSVAKRDSAKALMEAVIAHQSFFGQTYTRQFCLALLPSYLSGIKWYEKTFGSLSAFELNRITALSYERRERSHKEDDWHLYQAEKYWRLCVSDIKSQPLSKDESVKAALILRHLVQLTEERGEGLDDEKVPDDLALSLEFEPDDKISYLKLIKWYKHNTQQKAYHKWVETAVKRFPKDSDILFIAMEAANSKKAFKKAAGFAKTLLKVDPINVKARQMGQYSHISHARKLIKSEKYALAHKELALAKALEKNTQPNGLIPITEGLLELQEQGVIKPKTRRKTQTTEEKTKKNPSAPNALKLIQEGITLTGGSLVGQFRVIMESESQSLDCAKILSLLPAHKTKASTRQEILELIHLITLYDKEGVSFINKALDKIKTPVQQAFKLDFSQDEMVSLCECFKKIAHNKFLKQCAEIAIKRWPKHPPFVFYQIYSQSKGNMMFLNRQDFERLKKAAETAEQQGDKRTSVMIMGFVTQMGGGLFPSIPFFDAVDDDEEDEFFDEAFFDLEDMENELEALENIDLENMTPGQLIHILNRLQQMGIEIPEFLDLPVPPLPRKKSNKR